MCEEAGRYDIQSRKQAVTGNRCQDDQDIAVIAILTMFKNVKKKFDVVPEQMGTFGGEVITIKRNKREY